MQKSLLSFQSSDNNSSDSDNNSSDSASTSQINTFERLIIALQNANLAKDHLRAKACILAKAQASEASSKAKVQVYGSKAKVQTSGSKAKVQTSVSNAKVQASGSKAKIQASMAKASGLKAQASPKTLIVKIPASITNCVLGFANVKTWDAILSKTFGVKIPPTMTCVEEKKGKRKIIDNRKGPSIASVPKEGPSIQGLLDWYEYDTFEEYLEETYFPSTNKDITDKDSTDEDTIHESYSPMSK
nr:hypothetical protein [Tanacetum cinerariifolium]